MAISIVKTLLLFGIIMAMVDYTSCQLAAIATRLPEIITLLENVTDLDWQQTLQKTQNQIANSQNQTASTLTQMAHTQNQIVSSEARMEDSLTQIASSQTQTASTLTQIAISMNQVTNLLQIQSEQLYNMTAAMTTMVALLENQIELLNRLPPPRDCSDIAAQGYNTSRPYTITPQDGMGFLTVYCDLQTAGGGWTVFQRRYDGSVDFYLGWDDYERGFGSPDGEHWMALRKIHRLTMNGRWTLRIDMEAFDGDVAYAEYESFKVGDAASNYTLFIGTYSGNAGDSLTYHSNQPFSTYDNDHDQGTGDYCAKHWQGAWWYKRCHQAHLNGQYLGPSGNSWRGMVWDAWKVTRSLKKSSMKMRRVQ